MAEKVAYLKGLAEGMGVSGDSDQGKLMLAVIDALEAFAQEHSVWVNDLNGTFGAVGFLLAIVLMAGVRERLESSNIPKCFKGFPICLITAGLMSMAFMGFSGLVG